MSVTSMIGVPRGGIAGPLPVVVGSVMSCSFFCAASLACCVAYSRATLPIRLPVALTFSSSLIVSPPPACVPIR